jgi:rhodanese-related sulfurtransferase
MRVLKTTADEMVAAARARIEEIETPDAIAMHGDPGVVMVDLRDVRERERDGIIPGSFHCPRGMLEFWVDPKNRYFKPIFGEDKKFIFHCAAGWRSALAVALLSDMGFEAAHLKNGFGEWKKMSGPIEFPTPHQPKMPLEVKKG